MIKLDWIRQAMRLLKEPGCRHVSTAEQLATSLAVYKDRGEYDGTLDSAIECLLLAGYEIQGYAEVES